MLNRSDEDWNVEYGGWNVDSFSDDHCFESIDAASNVESNITNWETFCDTELDDFDDLNDFLYRWPAGRCNLKIV